MNKKKKIALGFGIAIAVFFGLGAIGNMSPEGQHTQQLVDEKLKADRANEITGIGSFVVVPMGSLHQVQFSLINANSTEMSSDAVVHFVVMNGATSVYSSNFAVKESDFQTYKRALTGAEFLAYVWQIDNTKLPKSDYTQDYKCQITVTLPNGVSYNAETPLF